MNTSSMRRTLYLVLMLSFASAGCISSSSSSATAPEQKETSAAPVKSVPEKPALCPMCQAEATTTLATPSLDDPPPEEEKKDDPDRTAPPEKDPPLNKEFKQLNKDVPLYFEVDKTTKKRRVHLMSQVCFREGPLEFFLCNKNTKEHESILVADMDPELIHGALIAAGAKPGTPVQFKPKFTPATGSTIKVSLTYYKNGKLQTSSAQSWIRDMQTKKEMPHQWVFAGSKFFQDPDDATRKPYYCAKNGAVISISNWVESMLDLPVRSSDAAAELSYEAFTEHIPPLKTKVLVTLEAAEAK